MRVVSFKSSNRIPRFMYYMARMVSVVKEGDEVKRRG